MNLHAVHILQANYLTGLSRSWFGIVLLYDLNESIIIISTYALTEITVSGIV